MTNAQNLSYATLQVGIEHKLKAFGTCAACRESVGISFEEVRTWFEVIAAENGLRNATITQSDSGRGTLNLVVSWTEIE